MSVASNAVSVDRHTRSIDIIPEAEEARLEFVPTFDLAHEEEAGGGP